ncbi:hypothetical protein L484_004016 [Morus notabilis]|uniref:Rx N-terminal domain-containing protein n=1 Tax=Morus notabilis TaxID=981085 RepID=W9QND4_9ROSA|nr:hypothetical protein L484_004016 [Morus notabilis]
MEAASIATNVIDKLLRLLIDEADSFREAIADVELLRQELEILRDLIETVKLLAPGAQPWLSEATRIAQRLESVL